MSFMDNILFSGVVLGLRQWARRTYVLRLLYVLVEALKRTLFGGSILARARLGI